jgi:hypothetical protein
MVNYPPVSFAARAALLELSRGKALTEVAATLNVASQTVAIWRDNYKATKLNSLLDKPRSSRRLEISGESRARADCLSVFDSAGRLRPLVTQALSGQSGRTRLLRTHLTQWRWRDTEKNALQPHLKKQWCIGQINAAFIARMEQILRLYSLPVDERFPIVCFDERPCFLIGNAVEALAMTSGQVLKEHYEYEKHGSCALLAAIEPLTGKRLARVFNQRRKKEYALFWRELAAQFPAAEKIRLIQDNLNTHNTSSLYETFPADQAFALANRFEFYDTPKKGSWLNMKEN